MPSVVRGIAEALPFRDASLSAVLAVTALEFVVDAGRALHEASRVLRRDARLVVGFLPRGGPWGIAYQEEGRAPASAFLRTRFFTTDELVSLAAEVGLQLSAARSTLLAPPGEAQAASFAEKASPEVGLVALAFEPQAPREGTHMTELSAQVSIYPLGQGDLSPAIEEAVRVSATHGLRV